MNQSNTQDPGMRIAVKTPDGRTQTVGQSVIKVRQGWLLETCGAGSNVGAAASEAVVTGGQELDIPCTRDVQTLFNVIHDVCIC